LTIKLTRHTAAFVSSSEFVIPSEARNLLSFRTARTLPSHHTPLQSYGPSLPAHRALNAYQCCRAPAGSFQALIKIYNAL